MRPARPRLASAMAFANGVARLLVDGLGCAILAVIAVEDWRGYRVRNLWIGLLVGLFLLSVWLDGRGSVLPWHALFGAAVLAVMFAAFALGGLGAGDAKMSAAACLWLGPEGAPVFAGALFVAALLSAAAALVGLLPTRRVAGRLQMPFGPGIAAAWIASILVGRAAWTA